MQLKCFVDFNKVPKALFAVTPKHKYGNVEIYLLFLSSNLYFCAPK